MTLGDLANYATVASGIALVLSVLFVGYELRVNAKLARASNAQSLVELASPLMIQLMHDRVLAQFWSSGPDEYEVMDEVDKYRYRMLIKWWLIFHENIFYQYHKGLLDADMYAAWDRELRTFVFAHRLDVHWTEVRHELQGRFSKYVDQILFSGHSAETRRESEDPHPSPFKGGEEIR